MVWTRSIAKLSSPENPRLRSMQVMGKLSTHTHECPRCGTKWECGEANYQDECPYPIKTLCTKCWAKDTPEDRQPSRLCFQGMVTVAPGLYRAIAASVLSLHAAYIAWVIFGAF